MESEIFERHKASLVGEWDIIFHSLTTIIRQNETLYLTIPAKLRDKLVEKLKLKPNKDIPPQIKNNYEIQVFLTETKNKKRLCLLFVFTPKTDLLFETLDADVRIIEKPVETKENV
jgi:hypothetical protein